MRGRTCATARESLLATTRAQLVPERALCLITSRIARHRGHGRTRPGGVWRAGAGVAGSAARAYALFLPKAVRPSERGTAMRRVLWATGLTLLVLVFLGGGAGVAMASECRPDCPAPSLQASVDLSSSVFRGTVAAISHVPHQPFGLYYRVEITVDAIWKGTPGSTVEVMTTSDVDGCAFYERGVFLVFAQSAGGEFWAAGCNRTHVTDSNDPDVPALGPPVSTPILAPSWGRVKVSYR